MSPPRRPRGEKPQTTIRYLRRQIRNLQIEVLQWRESIIEKDKKIAEYDVLHSEIENELFETKRAADHNLSREAMSRLNFLEGYYAKSTEIFVNDPTKTNPGSGPGNIGAFQTRPQTEGGGRQEESAQRTGGGLGSQIRGIRPDDRAYSSRGPVEKYNWPSS